MSGQETKNNMQRRFRQGLSNAEHQISHYSLLLETHCFNETMPVARPSMRCLSRLRAVTKKRCKRDAILRQVAGCELWFD